jgi:hypothetical protein
LGGNRQGTKRGRRGRREGGTSREDYGSKSWVTDVRHCERVSRVMTLFRGD